jgi:hypothetical protein
MFRQAWSAATTLVGSRKRLRCCAAGLALTAFLRGSEVTGTVCDLAIRSAATLRPNRVRIRRLESSRAASAAIPAGAKGGERWQRLNPTGHF